MVIDGEYDAFFLLDGVKVVMLTTPPYVEKAFDKYKKYGDYITRVMERPNLIIVHGFNEPHSMPENSVFVGPIVRELDGGGAAAGENLVIISIGVDPSQKLKDCAKKVESSARALGYEVLIIGKGMPEARFVDDSSKEFQRAKLIVAHGGISTIAEVVSLGKPLLVMCDDDAEKTVNGKAAESQGRAITVDCEALMEKVTEAVEKALSLDTGTQKMDGTAAAAELINELIGPTGGPNQTLSKSFE